MVATQDGSGAPVFAKGRNWLEMRTGTSVPNRGRKRKCDECIQMQGKADTSYVEGRAEEEMREGVGRERTEERIVRRRKEALA